MIADATFNRSAYRLTNSLAQPPMSAPQPGRLTDGADLTIAAAGSIALIAAFELVLRRTSPSPEITQDASRAKM